ncbi:MAG: hypothetical protein ACRCVT_01455, partial [Leadbetterella sp.]
TTKALEMASLVVASKDISTPIPEKHLKSDDDFITITLSPIEENRLLARSYEIPSIVDDIEIIQTKFHDDPTEDVFSKIAYEVKHLKKGETIDFRKFGLKSLDEILLNEDGFVITEIKKIKGTIQRIKSKLN